MSKITMQDIADALGTSRVTVWKTFNHRAGVSDEMKEKILEKAHELGYDKFSSEQYLPEPSKAKTVSFGRFAPGFFYFLDKHHSPYGTGTFLI